MLAKPGAVHLKYTEIKKMYDDLRILIDGGYTASFKLISFLKRVEDMRLELIFDKYALTEKDGNYYLRSELEELSKRNNNTVKANKTGKAAGSAGTAIVAGTVLLSSTLSANASTPKQHFGLTYDPNKSFKDLTEREKFNFVADQMYKAYVSYKIDPCEFIDGLRNMDLKLQTQKP